MYRLFAAGLLVIVLAGGSQAITLRDEMHSNISRGNRYYEGDEHEKALERYREAQGVDSTFAVPYFNAGDALYRMGNYRDGALEFLRSASADVDSVKAMSYYNLGNTMFRAGDLQSAVEAYKRSLLLNPEDQDAKYNLELALRMQQQEQQQPEEQQQEQQDQGKQQQQDQQQQPEDQQQDQQDRDQQQDQPRPRDEQKPPEISPEELERILAAIEASDKKTQEEMMKKTSRRKSVTGKDW
jgi:Ca-activated chloride channel family protein